jgi:hypothetical protein
MLQSVRPRRAFHAEQGIALYQVAFIHRPVFGHGRVPTQVGVASLQDANAIGTTPCHPRNVSLVGREYPAKTIGIIRACTPPSLQNASFQDASLSLSSWCPGYPAEGWVVFLNATCYKPSLRLALDPECPVEHVAYRFFAEKGHEKPIHAH